MRINSMTAKFPMGNEMDLSAIARLRSQKCFFITLLLFYSLNIPSNGSKVATGNSKYFCY